MLHPLAIEFKQINLRFDACLHHEFDVNSGASLYELVLERLPNGLHVVHTRDGYSRGTGTHNVIADGRTAYEAVNNWLKRLDGISPQEQAPAYRQTAYIIHQVPDRTNWVMDRWRLDATQPDITSFRRVVWKANSPTDAVSRFASAVSQRTTAKEFLQPAL